MWREERAKKEDKRMNGEEIMGQMGREEGKEGKRRSREKWIRMVNKCRFGLFSTFPSTKVK